VPLDATGSRVSCWSGCKRYCLAILLLVNAFNYLDRQVISNLAEPIKHDLHLADWTSSCAPRRACAQAHTLGISVGLERIHAAGRCSAELLATDLVPDRVGLGEAGATLSPTR
jgi:hypothetical protein